MIKNSRSIYLSLFFITLFAAFVRLWQVTTIPPGYWYDEAHKSIIALEIMRGLQAPIYVTDGQGIEAGYFWLLAGVFKIFGTSYFATRYLSALIGILTIPLTFWSIKKIYNDDRLALLSAGILSFLLWHIHWSRVGLETILVPFFSILLLGLMAWAWEYKTWWAFAFVGAVLGLSQYTNPGARILPLQALVTFLILGLSVEKLQIPSLQRLLKFGIVFSIGAFFVYAPLAWFFINNPEWFANRIIYTSSNARAGGWLFYVDSAFKTLLSLNYQGDVMQRHNLSLRPVFDALLSLWMFGGLAAMLIVRDRFKSHLILLSVIVINLAPMVFSDGAPGFGRTLGASPFVVVLPALGIAFALEWRPHLRWFVALSLMVSMVINLTDYFVLYPKQPEMFDSYEVGLWTLIQNATRTDSAYLILDEPSVNHPAVRMARELATNDLRIINGEKCFAYPAFTSGNTVFALQARWFDIARAELKNFSVQDVLHEPAPYSYGSILRVPRGEASVSGSGAALATFGDILELLNVDTANEITTGAMLPIKMTWRSKVVPPARYTTFVHLISSDKPYVTGVDGEPCATGYPTNQWHSNEVVQYQLILQVPNDLAPNSYEMMIGVYNTLTNERLPLMQTNQHEADRAFIKTLVVKK